MHSIINQPSRKLAPTIREQELMSLITKDYRELKNISESEQTDDLVQMAIRMNIRALKFIKNPTNDQIRFAIERDGAAIQYVKKKRQTEELCLAAIRKGTNSSVDIFLHCDIQTPEVCREAINRSFFALAHVQEQSEELCLLALKQTGLAAAYFKKTFDVDFYKKCVQINYDCLQFFKNKDIFNYDFALFSVSKNWKSLNYFTDDNKYFTEELCLAAYNQDVRSLQFLWPDFAFEVGHRSYTLYLGNDEFDIVAGKHIIKIFDNAPEYIQLLSFERERDISYRLEIAKRPIEKSSLNHKPVKRMDVF